MALRPLVALLIFLTFHEIFSPASAVEVKYWCQQPADDNDYFKFVVRLNREGESTITGITAVDASTNPTVNSVPTESTCKTTIEESSGIYVLSQEVGVNLECGVDRSGGKYDVQILAVGTKQYFTFTCDPNDLLPNSVSVVNFETTGVTNVLHYQENPYGVKFQVFEADHSFAPVRGLVELGQNIRLRLIYQTEHLDSKYDTWGSVFHTGFIHHSDPKITLQIITPGLGTSVHITGELSGNTIDEWVTVKRDRWAEVEILIPEYYDRGTATDKDWIIATKGIKIESLHDKIGVIVRGSSDGNADQYVVFPDDVLTTSRIRVLGSDNDPNADQEIVVVATEDDTDVTIRYNGFNKPGGLEIDGTNIGGGSPSTTLRINEYEILYIVCEDECYELTIEGDKKISIVTGFEDENHKDNNDKGTSSTQLIAQDHYADKFVFVESLFGNTGYFIYTDDPTQTGLALTDNTRNSDQIGSPYYLDWTGEGQSEADFNREVAAYMYATGSGSTTPAMIQYPSLAQWSTYNSFPVKEGVTYDITIVTTKGDAADIRVYIGGVTTSFTAATLGSGANFNTKLQDVSKLSTAGAGDANYEVYNNVGEFTVIDQDPTVTERGFIEFIAGKTWKPFMVLIHESNGDAQSLHLPIGVRYPVTNDCATSPTQPGDNIDNDCDGQEGEEILNGVDDDGDGKIDEDLALSPVTPSFLGIYVKDLYVDDNPAFSSPIQIHSSGCNVIPPPVNTVNTKVLSTIGPFERNTALNSIYSTHWVIQTPAFNAFKFVGQSTVYFRVTFDLCTADLTLCENSCQAKRKRKRSIIDKENFVDLMINIQGNDTGVHVVDSNVMNVRDAKNRDASRWHNAAHPCTHNAVLWLPVALLLVILLFEAAMTVVFLRMRSKFKNRQDCFTGLYV